MKPRAEPELTNQGPMVGISFDAAEGPVDEQVIQRVVRSHKAALMACWERALRTDAAAQGMVHLDFTIGMDGAVGSANSSVDGGASAELGHCMEKVIRAATFPAQDAATDATVTITVDP
jgi:hypothetical protein